MGRRCDYGATGTDREDGPGGRSSVKKVPGSNRSGSGATALTTQYKPERLRADHQTGFFDCGKESLNRWLDKHALLDQDLGISSTHVWVDAGGEYVVAYYTLLPTMLNEAGSDPGLWNRMKPPRFWPGEAYGVLLGKVALDESLQGQGLGVDLFADAFVMANDAVDLIGGLFLMIEPMDDDPGLRSMYEGFGFQTVEGTPRMYMTFKDFRAGTPLA